MTAFRPDPDGFAFANRFVLSPDERARLGSLLASAIDGGVGLLGPAGILIRATGIRGRLTNLLSGALPESYGLCGGMALAALDYFGSGRTCPRGTGADDVPAIGSPLRDYLWQRLIDSWIGNGAVFLELIARLHLLPSFGPFALGGEPALARRSRIEWDRLRASIDAGKPVALGLIGSTSDPFEDHQVVAYGYELAPDGGILWIYNMNCPDEPQSIRISFADGRFSALESCPGAYGELRAFFCETYTSAAPP